MSETSSCQYNISHMKRTCLNKDRCHESPSFIQRRLNYGTKSRLDGICLKLEHLCLQKHFFKKSINV